MLGQTVPELLGALFVLFDATLLVSLSLLFSMSFFNLLSEPLGVDFELPNRPSDLQK